MFRPKPDPCEASRGGRAVDDLIGEPGGIALELIHRGGALPVDFPAGLLAAGDGFGLSQGHRLAIETIGFLLRLRHHLLGLLTGLLELLTQVGLEALGLGQLLLGLGTAGIDVTLPFLHCLTDRAEEQGVENEGEDHHLQRHQRQGGVEVEETSLGRACFGEQ